MGGTTTSFNKISTTFDNLLDAIKNATRSNELSFEIDQLNEHSETLKKFVEKNFADFSPEKDKKESDRCSKNVVLQCVSETHYRFQSLSIKLNQFNAKLFDFVHAPSISQSTNAEEEQPEKIENNESMANESGMN